MLDTLQNLAEIVIDRIAMILIPLDGFDTEFWDDEI